MSKENDEEIVASLAAALPKGEHNGLSPYARLFADYPRKIRAALVLLDCTESKLKHADGSTVAKVRIRRVELIRDPDDAKIIERMLERAYETRTGAISLPFELEADVKAAFEDIDLDGDAEQERQDDAEAAEVLAELAEAADTTPVDTNDDPDAVASGKVTSADVAPDDASELFNDGEENDPTAGPWGPDEA